MSTTTLEPEVLRPTRPHGLTFGLCALGFVVGVAAVSGWLPIQFSIVSVFLCAGPHNWVEARYFLSRLPARWGRLQAYFLFGFAGVFTLTAGFAMLPHVLVDCWREHSSCRRHGIALVRPIGVDVEEHADCRHSLCCWNAHCRRTLLRAWIVFVVSC